MKTILVIGFPGAPATFATRALCRVGHRVVLLLDKLDLPAGRRLKKSHPQNIELLQGNPSSIDFGLGGDEYMDLALKVQSVVCLYVPPSSAPRGDPEFIRQLGREVLELGLAASSLERIIFLSSLEVCGDFEGKFAERDLEVGQHFEFPEAQSRFNVERVFRSVDRALPVTIIRSGILVGEGVGGDTTGEGASGEGIHALIHFALATSIHAHRTDPGGLLFTVLSHLVELVVWMHSQSDSLGGTTLHFAVPLERTFGEFISNIGSLAKSQVPGGFDLVAGAKRGLRSHRFTAKEFWKHNRFSANIETAWTRQFLHLNKLDNLYSLDNIWDTLVERAVDEIVGFR